VLDVSRLPTYSLGVLAYDMCGVPPVEEYTVAGHHIDGYTAEDINLLPPDYPDDFVALIRSFVLCRPGKLVTRRTN
jgi:hypothetical protein